LEGAASREEEQAEVGKFLKKNEQTVIFGQNFSVFCQDQVIYLKEGKKSFFEAKWSF
jgi:hypothetical protein